MMRWAVVALAVGMCAPVWAGENALVEQETIRARGLTGLVQDGGGNALPGARLEVFLCPHNYPHGPMDGSVLRSTRTGEDGRFRIEDVSGSQLRCVRISRRGYRPLVVRVKISLLAPTMKVRLARQD